MFSLIGNRCGAALLALVLCVSFATADVPYGPCFNKQLDQQLLASKAMPPMVVSSVVAIPFNTFWNFFSQAEYWPLWNPLFSAMITTDFYLCGGIYANYTNAPKAPFPPGMTDTHNIIQFGLDDNGTEGAYAWQFILGDASGNTIVFGRHTYTLTSLPNGFTSIASFEKAAGPHVEQYSFAWTVALEESLLDGVLGAVCLERTYLQYGSLAPNAVAANCHPFQP